MPLIFCAIPDGHISRLKNDLEIGGFPTLEYTNLHSENGIINVVTDFFYSPNTQEKYLSQQKDFKAIKHPLNILAYELREKAGTIEMCKQSINKYFNPLRSHAHIYCLNLEESYFRNLLTPPDEIIKLDSKYIEVVGVYLVPVCGQHYDNIPAVWLNSEVDSPLIDVFKKTCDVAIEARNTWKIINHIGLRSNNESEVNYESEIKKVLFTLDGKPFPVLTAIPSRKISERLGIPSLSNIESKADSRQSEVDFSGRNRFGIFATHSPQQRDDSLQRNRIPKYEVKYDVQSDLLTISNEDIEVLGRLHVALALQGASILINHRTIAGFHNQIQDKLAALPGQFAGELLPEIHRAISQASNPDNVRRQAFK